ncbi:ion transport peptide isoform X2 [Drosophila sulfurigaster albostrigata]|uniref:ion transport peptide isoform X2 n=1 Tax=Drosophila sulfurigaster albostrigata TaxID=89887 RepID=UPI002D21A44F|nr:ion transport peptide isoform X2 [Drosophila sulfurigaster albostrigata]
MQQKFCRSPPSSNSSEREREAADRPIGDKCGQLLVWPKKPKLGSNSKEAPKMCSRNIKISVVLFLVLIPIFTALPHNHNLSKRSNFFDLECKGIFNKTMFFRLDRICEDCYQLFRETSIHRLCKQDCFGSQFFNACVESLQLHDDMDKYNEWRDTLGRKK